MTNLIPSVAKLFVYPIKSLDRVAQETVTVLSSGALRRDREFAIFNRAGHFVNGKRYCQIHALRSQFDLENNLVSLQGSDGKAQFRLDQDRQGLEHWLGEYFRFPVTVGQNLEGGFPDDTASPGPTLISTATLEAVAAWYPGLAVEEVRRRFRANIELAGVPAFWEDQLFAAADRTVEFRIGKVRFIGVNPCQRCIVVTRNSQTGLADPDFQRTFVTRRQETLPVWSERSRFNHFYRLAINTRVPASEGGKVLRVGDELSIN